jgi:hypothetical protein
MSAQPALKANHFVTVGVTFENRNGNLIVFIYGIPANEEKNILQTVEQKKANWIGHTLRRNCLLKHTIE